MRKRRLRNSCDICGGGVYVQEYPMNGGLFLCSKHRHQMVRHGKIFERTMMDKNDTYVIGKVAHIVLRDGGQNIVGEALIDKDRLGEVDGIKWCKDNCGYARTGVHVGMRIRLLHKLLFRVNGEIDHINGNRLDNRKSNIRIASRSQNSFNRNKQINNTSGFRGVWFDKTRGKFVAELKCGKKIYLGRFQTFEDAKKERIRAEKKYFGKFRRRDG